MCIDVYIKLINHEYRIIIINTKMMTQMDFYIFIMSMYFIVIGVYYTTKFVDLI